MKSIILSLSSILFLSMFSTSMANAQSNSAPTTINKQEKAKQITDELNLYLNLDEKQKEAITKLHVSFLENLEKTRKDFDKKSQKAQMKILEKIKILNQEKETSLVKLLSPQQVETYNTVMADMKKVKKTPINKPAKTEETKTTSGTPIEK